MDNTRIKLSSWKKDHQTSTKHEIHKDVKGDRSRDVNNETWTNLYEIWDAKHSCEIWNNI